MTINALAYLADIPVAVGVRNNQFENRSASVFDFAYSSRATTTEAPAEGGNTATGADERDALGFTPYFANRQYSSR